MQLSTYSGAAVNGSLASNTGLFPTIQFGGVSQTGLAQVTVRMTTQHAHDAGWHGWRRCAELGPGRTG